MRHWPASSPNLSTLSTLPALIHGLGTPQFQQALLSEMHGLLPAASYALYRTGSRSQLQLFLSSSQGVPDQTHDCWRAYCAGLYQQDRTLPQAPATSSAGQSQPWISHITAPEVPGQHRQAIYEAHGLQERLSLHQPLAQGGVLALNYYRHAHQRAFSDTHIANFETMATALLALVEKHLQWHHADHLTAAHPDPAPSPQRWHQQLAQHCPALTRRELEVCVRLLQGMTYEGIASDLGLSATTAKTYRNRAFARLGIHFRNQLFALLQACAQPAPPR